jgi:UDP-4-amino-4,6-dideoxy-N-acetyl-beta-L-altrosamine transaminase
MGSEGEALAIEGGRPVRATLLPYGHQVIDDDDVKAVTDVLRSDWLTTGPKVAEFEEVFAAHVGAGHAVSFSSGTAALHAAAFGAGLGPGDEAVTTPMTFCATANCVLYQGAAPVFADVRPDTLNLDPAELARRITPRTKAVLPVDYAGHPADLDAILATAARHGLTVIEDACHALGARFRGRPVGSLSHMTVFSFHPVKHITAGEGGMVTTDDAELARRLRVFRNHGIDSDARARQARQQWFYEMVLLGYNYRLTDLACALGLSQLVKLPESLTRRTRIAARYSEAIRALPGVVAPAVRPEVTPAWHLYPIRLDPVRLGADRAQVFRALRAENIGVNVHYIPVPWHPYYQRLGYRKGEWPVAEGAYETLLTLPIWAGMTDDDIADVIDALRKVARRYAG